MKTTTLFFLLFIFFRVTAQSQVSWTMGMNIATSSSGNEHPRIVADASGNPLVLWGHASRAMFSKWNGTTFTTPVMVNPMTIAIAEASWMGPDIAAHGDTVYVVMKQTPEVDTSSHIYIVRSFDGGLTFSTPFQVDNISDSISRFPTVTIDDMRNPIVAFMKFDPGFFNARWVVTKSSDYGTTFSADVKASGWSAMGATVCDCCPGSIVYDANNVAMLYRDNNSNIRDSWAGISYNGGSTFSAGRNVDQNNWMIMACPSTGPDGIIIGDSLYSVFMNGASSTSRVYRSVSSISNATSQPSQLITGNIPGLAVQNYPRIARNGNAAAIVWQQTVSGVNQLPLLFTNDITNGFPAMYDTVDLANITNADVAISNGQLFVVWEDDNSGTVKFRKGTFSTTGINETGASNSVSFFPNPADGFISIRIKNSSILSIANTLGKQVCEQKIMSDSSILIDTKEFSDGVYFITIKSNDNIISDKIIIHHK